MLKAGFILLVISDLFSEVLPDSFVYCDEIIALFALLILVTKYNKKIAREKIILLLFGIVCVGLLGNVLSGIRKEPLLIMFDIFLFLKPFSIMMFLSFCTNNKIMQDTVKMIERASQFGIIMLFVFSLVTLVSPIGMVDADGNFVFCNSFYSGIIGLWSVCFASVLYILKKKHFLVYYLMALVVVLRSNSGFGLLIMVILIFIHFFVGECHAFHWYHLIPLIPIAFYVGREEIVNYLLNQNAPRSLLLRYAFVTANRYFPFGAGFGTFGTKVAAENYSMLYIDYGFNSRWGMTQYDTVFLLDSYHPQIVGQYGYFGLCLFTVLIYYLVTKYIFTLKNSHTINGLLLMIGAWVICGLGFNTSNSWGTFVLGFIMLSYKTCLYSQMQPVQERE